MGAALDTVIVLDGTGRKAAGAVKNLDGC